MVASMKISETIKSDPSWIAFLAAVFAMGLSLPLSRLFVVVSLILFFCRKKELRNSFRLTPPAIGWVSYLIVAFVVTSILALVNTDPLIIPHKGLGKIEKLLWYIVIPLAAAQVDTREKLTLTLKSLVCGCSIIGLFVIVINPILAWVQATMPTDGQVTAGTLSSAQATLLGVTNALGTTDSLNKWIADGYRAENFRAALFKLGTMQDAQRLMVALPAALCLCLDAYRHATTRRTRQFWTATLAIVFAGLFLTFKRGPLMFGVLVSFAILLRHIGVKAFVALLIVCALAAAHPAARHRFLQLPQEFSMKKANGRILMWTIIAPELHKQHPWGIGFRSLTNEKMCKIAKRVERRQNHLHSSPIQSWVDFGWLGLCVYLFWMGTALSSAVFSLKKTAHSSGLESTVFLAPLAMLSALVLYSLMEYNLADAEVVLLYALTMGLATFHTLPQLANASSLPLQK